VYRFDLPGEDGSAATTSSTTAPADVSAGVVFAPTEQPCVNVECQMRFGLKPAPAGTNPSATLLLTTDPYSIRVQGSDFGEPIDWLRPDGPNVEVGATAFGAYLSTSDDNPIGGLLCIFDENLLCEGDTIPNLQPSYHRLTILALKDANTAPTLQDGLDRLMTTMTFEPPLTVVSSE
jgi:hypothetical protein